MTSAEITRELRAARPAAPPALRARVLADASRPAGPAPSLLERLRRRRLVLLVPAATALAGVAAVAIAVGLPADAPQVTRDAVGDVSRTKQPESALDSAGGTAENGAASGTPQATAPSTALVAPRAQQITAQLELRVKDGNALSDAVADALRMTRSLGGYVVTSDVVAGETGAASLRLRVPAAAAQDAIAKLSALGTITGQRVQAIDLQEGLDALTAELRRLTKALATVRARLANPDLDAETRAVLQARRDELVAQLRGTRGQRDATEALAAEATIDLTLRTAKDASVVPLPSRLDRTLDRALDILVWEALIVLGLALVLAPLALVLVALRVGRRSARRWGEERVLGQQ